MQFAVSGFLQYLKIQRCSSDDQMYGEDLDAPQYFRDFAGAFAVDAVTIANLRGCIFYLHSANTRARPPAGVFKLPAIAAASTTGDRKGFAYACRPRAPFPRPNIGGCWGAPANQPMGPPHVGALPPGGCVAELAARCGRLEPRCRHSAGHRQSAEPGAPVGQYRPRRSSRLARCAPRPGSLCRTGGDIPQ